MGYVTIEQFALKPKYFYGEENLEVFRENTPPCFHEKAMENKVLAGGSVVATLLVVVGVLVIGYDSLPPPNGREIRLEVEYTRTLNTISILTEMVI